MPRKQYLLVGVHGRGRRRLLLVVDVEVCIEQPCLGILRSWAHGKGHRCNDSYG